MPGAPRESDPRSSACATSRLFSASARELQVSTAPSLARGRVAVHARCMAPRHRALPKQVTLSPRRSNITRSMEVSNDTAVHAKRGEGSGAGKLEGRLQCDAALLHHAL